MWGRIERILIMACDRKQAFLLPPGMSPRSDL
jgi:hypothetical protein